MEDHDVSGFREKFCLVYPFFPADLVESLMGRDQHFFPAGFENFVDEWFQVNV